MDKIITCDQFFINDIMIDNKIIIDDQEIYNILKKLQIDSVVSSIDKIIGSLKEQYIDECLNESDWIIIPGKGGEKFASKLGLKNSDKCFCLPSVSRKLNEKGTPKGIIINKEDEEKLREVGGNIDIRNIVTIYDDVIASGCTNNSLYKKIMKIKNLQQKTLWAITGVLRKPNDLNENIKVVSGIIVEKNGGGKARINSLSTFVEDTPKSQNSLQSLEKYYGKERLKEFVIELRNLY